MQESLAGAVIEILSNAGMTQFEFFNRLLSKSDKYKYFLRKKR